VTTVSAVPRSTGKSPFRHFLVSNALVLVLYAFLLVALVGLSIYSPTFRSAANLWTVARQAVIPGIIGIAQTLIILSGGIDLSVASLVTFISLVGAGLTDNNDGRFVWVALLMLGVGLLVGAFNGLVVTRGRVPPFIATLGTSLLLQGAGLAYTTVPKGGIPTSVANLLYYSQLGPLPFPLILFVIIFALAWLVLSRTDFGRAIYAVGGNAEVARRAGIHVNRMRVAVFCLGGFLVSVAALIVTARNGIGDPLTGMGMELDSITAVVIGGTSLFGGRGNLFGTLAGVLILTLINSVMVTLNVSTWYQQLIKGIVVLVVVAIYKQRA
jgi:ribose transport system permease protein